MLKRTVSGIMLTLLTVSMLTLALNVQPVRASGTIYIRADGSIEPSTAPIKRDGDFYTLTDDIFSDTDGIMIERNNMTLDGANYTVQGTGLHESKGIDLTGRENVTVRNTQIINFHYGILLWSSSYNSVSGNNMTANSYAIWLDSFSNNNSISENNITNNYDSMMLYYSSYNTINGNNMLSSYTGITLYYSSYNTINGNNITTNEYDVVHLFSSFNNTISGNSIAVDNGFSASGPQQPPSASGIWLRSSSYNSVSGNNITTNCRGIKSDNSSYNTINENNIADNSRGIELFSSSNSSIYHNNFIDNTQQVYDYAWDYPSISPSNNVWDDSYPSGGNYWSDYTGVDANGDGIGDTPYVIDASNQDNCPLVGPISIFNAGTWNDTTYYINMTSNSTLSSFYFNPVEGAFFRFGVSGENETLGFCRVAIPKELLWVEDGWTIYYGSVTESYTAIQDENYTYLYFTYQHPYPGVTTYVEIVGTNVIGGDTTPTTIAELKTEIEEFYADGEIDNQGILRGLVAKLNVAQRLIEKGKIEEAQGILEDDFIPQVQNLSGIHITPEAADILIKSAEYILTHL